MESATNAILKESVLDKFLTTLFFSNSVFPALSETSKNSANEGNSNLKCLVKRIPSLGKEIENRKRKKAV
ncbi:MAG: hypothetical protein BroJett020_14010 [Bacteroidota bacterium]|nr:MAG: hypothetical protein BroJett020_14010 [Bacteroidota bacterium]